MTRARPRSPDEIRRLLLDSAGELFASQGYAGTSTRQVARHAGVAASQLFAHFGDKPRLFEASVTRAYADVVTEYVRRWESTSHDDVETVELTREITGQLFDLFSEHRGLIAALVLAREHEPELIEGLGHRDDAVQRLLIPLERFTEAEARRRGYSPSRPLVALRLLHGTMLAAAMFEVFGDEPSDAVVDKFSYLMTRGLVSDTSGPATWTAPAPATAIAPSPTSDGQRRLMDIARELFCRSGYTNTGIRSIAAAAGTSESAMFRHFPDKQALFDRAVTETWLVELSQAVVARDQVARSEEPRAFITAEAAWLVELFTGGRGLLLGLLETTRANARSAEAIRTTMWMVVDSLERRLPRRWHPGRLNLSLLLCMVLGATVLNRWLFDSHEAETEPPAVIENIATLALDGFAQPVNGVVD